MRRVRVIPVLLLQNAGLVKTVRFKNPTYVGDPLNAVKIFNEKEVDEIAVLDIDASKKKSSPQFSRISDIAGECFMPLAYGGGISSIDEIKKLLSSGIEKAIINTAAFYNPQLVTGSAKRFGSQSIMVSIDVKKNLLGKYQVHVCSGEFNTKIDPVTYAKKAEQFGAGEIFLNSIDRDGTYQGYDLELVKQVASAVNIPVIACGGARNIDDLFQAVKYSGASAVAAGSQFVFHGKHRAVLINYPSQTELKEAFYSKL